MTTRFVGRADQLRELARILERHEAGVITQTLTGLGGIGKTELALEYGRRSGASTVWMIKSETEALQQESLVALAERLRAQSGLPDFEISVNDEGRAAWGVHWLQTHDSWLLIHDNAEDASLAIDLITTISGSGRHIITTRRPGGWSGVGEVLTLDALAPDESAELLLNRTNRDSEAARVEALLLNEFIDGVPQLLVQAAGVCAQQELSFGEYLRRLTETPVEMMARRRRDDLPESRAWDRVWAVSLEAVRGVNAAALDLLGLMSWLAPDGFPRDLFAVLRKLAIDDALGVLADYSMINLTGSLVSVHRTVQLYARLDPATNGVAGAVPAGTVLETAIRGLNVDDPQTWPRWRELLPSMSTWLEHAADHDHKTAAWLAYRAGSFEHAQGRPHTALTFLEQCAEINRVNLGPEDPETLTAKNNVAQTLQALGDYAGAREIEIELLEIRRHRLGEDHEHTLATKGNLAGSLWGLGENELAKALEEEVLDARIRNSGIDNPNTLTAMNNLASTLFAMGEFERSHNLQSQVVEARLRVLGPNNSQTLGAQSNLATTLKYIGDFEGAKRLQEQIVESLERELGSDHTSTLTAKNNLALTLKDGGELERASAIQLAVVDARIEVLGPNHPHTLSARNNLTSILSAAGDSEANLEQQFKIVDILAETQGPKAQATATAKHNLGVYLVEAELHEEAVLVLNDVVGTRRETIGPTTPTP